MVMVDCVDYMANPLLVLDIAAHECVSEDALVHLRSYKYSSVDKSLISKYILKHYVWTSPKCPCSDK